MTENSRCEFCGSGIPVDAGTCPRCGSKQGDGVAIPPPSPYYQEVIPPEPPAPETPPVKSAPLDSPNPNSDQLQQVADLTGQARDAISAVLNREKLAVIALVIGVIGIPLAFMTGGCSLVGNIAGFILARMARRSSRRRMAAAAMALNLASVIIILIIYVIVAVLVVNELINSA